MISIGWNRSQFVYDVVDQAYIILFWNDWATPTNSPATFGFEVEWIRN